MFEKLNILNKSLQEPNKNVVTATEKLKSFEKKLMLWKNRLIVGNLESFSLSDKDENKRVIIEDAKRKQSAKIDGKIFSNSHPRTVRLDCNRL